MKRLWPQAPLILVCRQGVGTFFLEAGLVDEVIEIKKGDADSYRGALQSLNSRTLETVISAHGSLRTAFFVKGLKAGKKIGFKTWWNFFFYQERVVKNLGLPDAIRQLSLLKPFDQELTAQIQEFEKSATPYLTNDRGQLPAPPPWASMNLQACYSQQSEKTQRVLQRLKLSLSEVQTSVAFFPGSVWATKRWTAEGFIGLGQELSRAGVPVLVMGGPGEESLCAEVAAEIPESKDLSGQTSIFESALMLSQVAAVVGNDSASLHLAATSETPSVAVFGPTVLEFGFRPWQGQAFIAEVKDLSCRPCGKHGHQQCPLGHHACMKQISKHHVGLRLQQALTRPPR
jgi:heptosyltransferase-2